MTQEAEEAKAAEEAETTQALVVQETPAHTTPVIRGSQRRTQQVLAEVTIATQVQTAQEARDHTAQETQAKETQAKETQAKETQAKETRHHTQPVTQEAGGAEEAKQVEGMEPTRALVVQEIPVLTLLTATGEETRHHIQVVTQEVEGVGEGAKTTQVPVVQETPETRQQIQPVTGEAAAAGVTRAPVTSGTWVQTRQVIPLPPIQ